MEKWKKVKGYVNYECSNLGRIKTHNWKNTGKTRIMKPALDGCGYLRTVLKRESDGKLCTIKVHRIIAENWLVAVKENLEVNHKNGIKTDNRIINLEWVTRSQNIQHSYDSLSKIRLKGCLNPAAIVNEKDVLEIRKNYKTWIKQMKRKQIAHKYGISESALKSIISKRTWSHI